MNQSKLEKTSKRKARENACEWVRIGFGFTSDWMRKWRELFKSCGVQNAKPIAFRHSKEKPLYYLWCIILHWTRIWLAACIAVDKTIRRWTRGESDRLLSPFSSRPLRFLFCFRNILVFNLEISPKHNHFFLKITLYHNSFAKHY